MVEPTGDTSGRGVTPAVALVVMMVISIGLAAVLGLVLFGGGGGGGGGSQPTKATANLTFDESDDGTGVTITVDDPGNTDTIRFSTTCNGSAPADIGDPTAGTSVTVSGCSSGNTITVIGVSGGTETLLRKYEV